jgi:tRNA (guanine26-N2/guanine27-N2)-dimethyltransferase
VKLAEVTEGKARILVPDVPRLKGPGRKHAGFYNPLMAFNRDVSVLVLAALAKRAEVKRPLDGMAGTGIRGVRWALEVPGVEVGINEPSRAGNELAKRNVGRNGAEATVYGVGVATATMEHKADLVDIDPFGSPVPFFFPTVQNIRRGYVSVTATDAAALAGALPHVAKRRYQADLARTSIVHEAALRTLVGSLVRDAARTDRAAVPVLAYHADHYYRVYLRMRKNAEACRLALRSVEEVEWDGIRIGPLWSGELADAGLLRELADSARSAGWCATRDRMVRMLGLLDDEYRIPSLGFHRVDNLARTSGTEPMSPDALVRILRETGFRAARTHFDPGGVRTDATREEVLVIVRAKASPSARRPR